MQVIDHGWPVLSSIVKLVYLFLLVISTIVHLLTIDILCNPLLLTIVDRCRCHSIMVHHLSTIHVTPNRHQIDRLSRSYCQLRIPNLWSSIICIQLHDARNKKRLYVLGIHKVTNDRQNTIGIQICAPTYDVYTCKHTSGCMSILYVYIYIYMHTPTWANKLSDSANQEEMQKSYRIGLGTQLRAKAC